MKKEELSGETVRFGINRHMPRSVGLITRVTEFGEGVVRKENSLVFDLLLAKSCLPAGKLNLHIFWFHQILWLTLYQTDTVAAITIKLNMRS